MHALGRPLPYRPRHVLGQPAGFTSFLNTLLTAGTAAYTANQQADIADEERKAAEAMRQAAEAAARAQALAIEAAKAERAEDFIPGVPNTVTVLGGLALLGVGVAAAAGAFS